MSHLTTTNSRFSPWLTPIAYFINRYFVLPFYFGRIEVTGQENIPQDGPVLITPTHRSRWDSFIVPLVAGRYVTGRDVHFMVMSTEMKGFQGWLIERLGGYPVNLDHPGVDSILHSVDLLVKGKMLTIFPEGGIFRDPWVHSLKRGVSLIALEAEAKQPGIGVKILPISIKYTQAYPTWGSNIQVNIGSAINVVDYQGDSLRKNSQKLNADLEKVLKKLHQSEESISEGV